MGNQACFIIKYPQRVVVDDQEYDYFMLWADKTHIVFITELFLLPVLLLQL